MKKNKQNLSHNIYGDRFIPIQVQKNAFQLQTRSTLKDICFSNYQKLLDHNILQKQSQSKNLHSKIMNFTSCKPMQTSIIPPHMIKHFPNTKTEITQKRRISKKAYKVFQAPNLQDNFYMNILDWSKDNRISVALENQLYLLSPHSKEAVKVYQTDFGNQICSLAFCGNNTIALGNTLGEIIFIDLIKQKICNKLKGHIGRIGSLNWATNILASGSKDGKVGIWDPKYGNVYKYKAHSQEICGLKWSPDRKFIASGGNDNKLLVYSHEKQSQLIKFHQHSAAIKALGWCQKNPSVLASGGGTIDRCLRFFSLNTLKESFHIDTGSQVCNLTFSKISNEMITTHGYSLNQVNLWRSSDNWQSLNGLSKIETFTGHANRVLYLAEGPDGKSIATGAGDQKLQLWNVFDTSQVENNSQLELDMDLR